ncbi:DgyrCDS1679 [Dimorphilus gyrociliatus]|uniref:DgyrCDS1679 n=1 Tax=Dimorphilus gyrociliatus TaxID=2664684 RepID=A0A7I8V841_9ANNE|nr:DgyrCDS1679 [Dimorphilus gyrociliatus]
MKIGLDPKMTSFRCLLLLSLLNFSDTQRHLTFTKEPEDIISTRGSNVHFKCSSTLGKISWRVNNQPIISDQNRIIKPNGILKIRNVKHSNYRYQCVAEDKSGIIVSRKASLKVEEIKKVYVKRLSSTLPSGGSVVLQCVSGSQRKDIDIKWFFDDKLIKKSLHYNLLADGSLEIINADNPQEGLYYCTSHNRKSNSIPVSIEVAINNESPIFNSIPSDKTVIVGETVVFHCSANALKSPTIQWLKDGAVISSNKDTNCLTINNVSYADRGWYTCRASTATDTKDESAELFVNSPPFFKESPQDIEVQKASTATITCRVDGMPTPKVSWYKNGELIQKSDYFKIEKTGDLKIIGVMKSDEGIYQCFAENFVGSRQKAMRLSVSTTVYKRSETGRSNKKPKLLEIITVADTSVKLKWLREIFNNEESYLVTLTAQGSNRPRAVEVTTNQVSLDNLKPDATYKVGIQKRDASSSLGESAELIFRTKRSIKPTSPLDVIAEAKSNTTIKVTWKVPESTGSSLLDYYEVVYSSPRQQQRKIEEDGNEVILKNLFPFELYDIRVRGVNYDGEKGEFSGTISVRTLGYLPTGPPRNVIVEATGSSQILIEWKEPRREHINGVITGYSIKYKKSSAEWRLLSTPATRTQVELTELDKNTLYFVEVAARNNHGVGPYSPTKNIKTLEKDFDESQIPAKPINFKAEFVDGDIVVTWGVKKGSNIRIRSYLLEYGKFVPTQEYSSLTGRTTRYVIKKPEPKTLYLFQIVAKNNFGKSAFAVADCHVPDYTVDSKSEEIETPLQVQSVVLGAHSISLKWTYDKFEKGMEFTVRCISSNRKTHLYKTQKKSLTIRRLRPYSLYTMDVMVTDPKGRKSGWSMVVENRTGEAAPSTPPQNVTVGVFGKVIRLTWQPPKRANGKIISYRVGYSKDISNRRWIYQTPKLSSMSIDIKNLEPGQSYVFEVRARNSVDLSPTEIVKFRYAPKKIAQPKEEPQPHIKPAVLYSIIGSVVGFTAIVVIIISIYVCRRRKAQDESRGHYKAASTKSNDSLPSLKPPDLWIHDQMELKNVDKRPQTPSDDERYSKRPLRKQIVTDTRNSALYSSTPRVTAPPELSSPNLGGAALSPASSTSGPIPYDQIVSSSHRSHPLRSFAAPLQNGSPAGTLHKQIGTFFTFGYPKLSRPVFQFRFLACCFLP